MRDVTVSLPRLVGGAGVLATFVPPLDEFETTNLRQSAEIVRQAIKELDEDSLDLPECIDSTKSCSVA
ncbi:MAG: hypothetical protein LDL33_05235 [Desulfomonile sp.]|nr:hypothetical protein [Desulfomonile sp.]